MDASRLPAPGLGSTAGVVTDIPPAGPAAGEPDAGAPDAGGRPRRRGFDPAAVTSGELLTLGAAVAVAVFGLVSLAAAHLGRHSLGAVALGSAPLLAALAVAARVRAPRVVTDLPGLLALAGSGIVAAVMFVPGFHYVAGDKDPGGYVMHAFMINRTGSYAFTDALLTTPNLPVQVVSRGARFAGIWIHDAATGEIVPQFYHLWPALLASANDAGGYAALSSTAPVAGVLAVLAVVAVVRRIAGALAGGVAGVLLATNMMEVWQAKYPTAEILNQLLLMAALLGVIVAAQARWRWPALAAGLLIGVSYLARADGVVIVLIAAGTLAVLWVLGRFDARTWWFAAGLGAVLPYGLWQAYGPAREYTLANDIPGLTVVLGLLLAAPLGAAVLRRPLAPVAGWLNRWVDEPERQRRLGVGWLLLCLGLFALGLGRPVFGPDYFDYNGRILRSYDELSVWRLSWFFSWPGLAVMLIGIGYLALRRRSTAGWLLVLPTVGLLALYCWHARNSPYFMWLGRRFVPSVLPGMIALIAIGLAWIWTVRARRGRLPAGPAVAALLLAFLGAVQLGQSLPLRTHDEWGGSRELVAQVADLSGRERGIYLWSMAGACCTARSTLLSSPVWLVAGEDAVALPPRAPAVPDYVRAYLRTFPDRPVFLVYDQPNRPPPLPGVVVSPVRRFTGALPHWEQSSIRRPDHAERLRYDFTVYRVRTAASP